MVRESLSKHFINIVLAVINLLVAVNCAALPNDLIESELFGYAPGSFTGVHPRGYSGRIRLADKGILFLDEIGEMSMQAQCRLLSVLQDKTITPLGSARSYKVDIEVIAATHQDLDWLVAKGRFQDLYYRLNGMAVELPVLRNRKDKAELIKSIHMKSIAIILKPSRQIYLSI